MFLRSSNRAWRAVGLEQQQAKAAELQAVGVFAEPGLGLLRPFAVGAILEQPLAVGVKDLAAVGVVGREDVFDRELLRVGGTVPAPLRLRAQLNAVGVDTWERSAGR